MSRGTLIVLNGGSSAGKTSIGEALQDQFDEPYLLLGIDAFYGAMPPKQQDPKAPVSPSFYRVDTSPEGGLPRFLLLPGPVLDQIMFARYRAIATILDQGLNVISDEIYWKHDWLLEALRVMQTHRAFSIGVFVSAEVAEQRHRSRGRDLAGLCRGSAEVTHQGVVYDMTVDTSNLSPSDCARTIKTALDEGLEPRAFPIMRASMSD